MQTGAHRIVTTVFQLTLPRQSRRSPPYNLFPFISSIHFLIISVPTSNESLLSPEEGNKLISAYQLKRSQSSVALRCRVLVGVLSKKRRPSPACRSVAQPGAAALTSVTARRYKSTDRWCGSARRPRAQLHLV